MKFLPVQGTKVMFCIHEVRYKDYAAYAAESPGIDDRWKNQTQDGFALMENKGEHPVVYISWDDAQAFCAWLSKKEDKNYRLPTDNKWSFAVGIGRNEKWGKDTTPATVLQGQTEFPWGDKWLPPEGAGNYGDQSRKAKAPGGNALYLDGYDDGYPTTAPVMNFKPNQFGLYDLGGNVMECVEDWYSAAKTTHVLRGGSWNINGRETMLSSHRQRHSLGIPSNNSCGFRVVVAVGSGG